MTFMLRMALIFSLLIHLLLLAQSSSQDVAIGGVTVDGGSSLRANLHVSVNAKKLSQNPPSRVSHAYAEKQKTAGSGSIFREGRRGSAVVRSTANSGQKSSQGREASFSVQDASQNDAFVISEEIVAKYRLALARELRLLKQRAVWIRDALPEGEVLLNINMSAKSGLPELILVRSSGQEILDQRVVAMVSQVLADTALPESLKDRRLSIELLVSNVGE